VIGNNHFSIASKFNFSSLKKRIAMMNKMKTARVHVVKFLFVLPLVAVLLVAFRKKEYPVISDNSPLKNVPKEISFSSVRVSCENDTIPKAKKDKKQMDDRSSDNFEITEKKAVIHLRNGKTEEYDLTDSMQRRKFEDNYGKIISVAANADDLAPVSVVTENGETVAVSQPVIETTIAPAAVTISPVAITTANGETVIVAKPAKTVKTSTTTIVSPVASAESVTVVDDSGYAITADKNVLVTITKNTTAAQLEDLKRQMKEKGYELTFDKTTYNEKGTLTHISGTIKSQHEQNGNFSATDFEKLIVAEVKENYRILLRIEIVDKKKTVI